MKKNLAALISALALTACATASAPQGYRPAGSAEAPWQILARYNEASGNTVILINGKAVLEGSFGVFSSGVEMWGGEYQGKAITASCNSNNGFWTITRSCMVFVNNERAATLTF